MNIITLNQILQYLNKDEGEYIQIVTGSCDWDDPYEIESNCELLVPFYDYLVTDIRPDLSYMTGNPIFRVAIEKNNIIPMRKE